MLELAHVALLPELVPQIYFRVELLGELELLIESLEKNAQLLSTEQLKVVLHDVRNELG